MIRKQTSSLSTIEVARVLSLVTGFILAGYGGAFIAGAKVAHAASAGGGTGGSGGTGAGAGGTGAGGTGTGGTGAGGTGTGGTGTGGTGTGGTGGTGTGGTGTGGTGTGGTGTGGTGTGGTGTGGTGTGGTGTGGTGTGGTGTGAGKGTGGAGTGVGTGIGSGTGSTGGTATDIGIGGPGSGSGPGIAGGPVSGGNGEGRAGPRLTGGDQHATGAFSWVTRSTGIAGAQPRTAPAFGPPLSVTVTPTANPPPIGAPNLVNPAAVPALSRASQAFRFDVGTAVFPTTGGMLTTEGVDGVDLVTVDARHHRVIHPAAFFEPHEGAQYDRRAVERFWPIELGKPVRFVEAVGNQRWLHVMSAVRVETVSVPAGLFRTFVVERTMQSLEPGARPAATYTYWYAPDAGAIVKTELRPGDGRPAITEEADVIGYPLSRLGATSTGALPQ